MLKIQTKILFNKSEEKRDDEKQKLLVSPLQHFVSAFARRLVGVLLERKRKRQ